MTTAVAQSESALETITLPVEGMTCAACQANVQRALAAAPGVERAAVNLMTHEATVVYDPRMASPESLVRAVETRGYVSRLREPRTAGRDGDQDEREHTRVYRSPAQIPRQYGARIGRDDRLDAPDGRSRGT